MISICHSLFSKYHLYMKRRCFIYLICICFYEYCINSKNWGLLFFFLWTLRLIQPWNIIWYLIFLSNIIYMIIFNKFSDLSFLKDLKIWGVNFNYFFNRKSCYVRKIFDIQLLLDTFFIYFLIQKLMFYGFKSNYYGRFYS